MFMLLFILVTVTEEHPTVSQGTDVLPARIYGSSSNFSVGENLEIKCSTFGLKTPEEEVYVYLCKNRVGIERALTKDNDHIFQIKSAKKEDTGNYSCMFSRTKHHHSVVKAEGEQTFIIIRVIDKLYPAIIVADESTVIPGSDVNFSCTSTDAPDTGILLAYLCRNQSIIAIEMWDSWTKQATFSRKRVQKGDKGSYSCVVSQRPLNAMEKNVCEGNSVFLQVKEKSSNVSDSPGASCSPSCGAGLGPLYLLPSVLLLLLLILMLWKNGMCTCKGSPQVLHTEYTDFLPLAQTSPAQNHVDFTTTGQQIPVQSVYSQGERPGVDGIDTESSVTQQGDDIAPYYWDDIPDHNSQGLQIPVQSLYSQCDSPGVDSTAAATSNTQQDPRDDKSSDEWSECSDEDLMTYQEIPDIVTQEAKIAPINTVSGGATSLKPPICATYAKSIKRQKTKLMQ